MDNDEDVPLQCVLHVSGYAIHSGTVSVSVKRTWEAAGLIAKARKKSIKRDPSILIYVNPIYTTVPL